MANTGRMNLLEEEGRIKSEPQTKNVKDEEKRVVGEIKKGYKTGGRVGLKNGGSAGAVMSGKKVGVQIR